MADNAKRSPQIEAGGLRTWSQEPSCQKAAQADGITRIPELLDRLGVNAATGICLTELEKCKQTLLAIVIRYSSAAQRKIAYARRYD